jgi:hypothetical protein
VAPEYLFKERGDGTMKSLISINGTEVLPLAGIANKLVVVCNEGGQFLTYRSDQYGFNNPRNLWREAPVDIVAVGDSYVQGWCVAPDDSFVALIRKHYPSTMNLGMEGYGPLLMLATLKEYAQTVRPRIVLWFYYEGNDLANLRRERKTPLLQHYLTNDFSQGLLARQKEIDSALDAHIKAARKANGVLTRLNEIAASLKELPGKARSIIALSQLRARFGLVQGKETYRRFGPTPASIRDSAEIELLGDILVKAKESVSAWGGSLYFVYLTAQPRYIPEQIYYDRDQVLQKAHDAGLPVIDLFPTFQAQKDPLDLFALRLQSHYNREGHHLVAEEVLRSISVGR